MKKQNAINKNIINICKIIKNSFKVFWFFFIFTHAQKIHEDNVFITGGNQGIGFALVKRYLENGDTVYTTYRNEESALELLSLSEENLIRVKVDFSKNDAIIKIKGVLAFTPLDLLIHNAGVFPFKADRAPDLDTEDWLAAFKVNTIFPIQLTFALKNNLLKSPEAKVVFVSSRRASNTVNIRDRYEGRYGYRSSKAALNSAVVALAQDFEKDRIAVVMIHPGSVATQMTYFKGISPKESAKSIFSAIQKVKFSETGNFINVENYKILPW